MAKEYTHRHGRRKKRKKSKGKKKKPPKKKAPAAPFRRRRRYAARPRRAPAQGPPFLPYDPWARQRRGIQRQEEQQLEQMTRIARERAQRQAHSEDGGDDDEFSIGGL